ncbi:hypothetical protein [Vagococcus silagei]|uniref:Uncharacterized protein n=1 Tax=Vagococcus silagei TaxID=2508885 RepID=A0A4S3B4U2_9ENTE|nr:hypothetical protein [Vagococcus silagei]THB62091.1 hypothetical protein ESZ54_02475 [Vagococcus silagei]
MWIWLVLSIIFSLVSLVLPVIRFFKTNKYLHLYSFISVGLALACQIFYVNSLVRTENFVVLLETSTLLAKISSALFIVALVFNLTGLMKQKK